MTPLRRFLLMSAALVIGLVVLSILASTGDAGNAVAGWGLTFVLAVGLVVVWLRSETSARRQPPRRPRPVRRH